MPRATNSTPSDDLLAFNEFEYQGEKYTTLRKFKMVRFFRLLEENPISAIALILTDESLARLEEKDMDMDDFKDLLEIVAKSLGAESAGN